MATLSDEPAKIWSRNYRVLQSVISSVDADITALGLDSKELFLFAEIDEHPYPAELASTLSMPKATVTVYLKRLEADGFGRPGIDSPALRGHRARLPPATAPPAAPHRGRASRRPGRPLAAVGRVREASRTPDECAAEDPQRPA